MFGRDSRHYVRLSVQFQDRAYAWALFVGR